MGTYSWHNEDDENGASPLRGVEDTIRFQRVSLGKGKFSEVLLVRKAGTEYALKHTALHPHHELISSRLLREPAILAQLLPHRNLVKVFETIRTPGHFYLVEESLASFVTLEDLVSSSPDGVLSVDQAWALLEQLASVVRSLHEPLRVCHRDIKPENILIRIIPPSASSPPSTPPTLLLKLLDFGLATHFSASEAKLTTCCGSPAYHSPELWRGLRDRAGAVRYHGPEIDVWCVGLTILRCLTPSKYPLGIGHTTFQALADKVVDALLTVRDAPIRQVLAGFLHLDGRKRMRAFDRFCDVLPDRLRERAEREGRKVTEPKPEREKKDFKTTSFLPGPLQHHLELYLDAEASGEGPQLHAAVAEDGFNPEQQQLKVPPRRTSRSVSSARTIKVDDPVVSPTTVLATGLPRPAPDSPPTSPSAASSRPWPTTSARRSSSLYDAGRDSPASFTSSSLDLLSLDHPTVPPPIEIGLLNPDNEPIRRAVSYIKYALRCRGILYHVQEGSPSPTSSRGSFASPASIPPSLPPTPYILPPSIPSTASPSSFPFPNSSPSTTLADESYVCYLQCVVALPPSPSPTASPVSAATARLRAALDPQNPSRSPRSPLATSTSTSPRRPRLGPRAHTDLGATLQQYRSASTPPQQARRQHAHADSTGAGRDKKGKASAAPNKVDALTFFLSIRKVDEGDEAFDLRGRRRTSAGTDEGGARSRIVLTLSDDRAVPFVREALAARDSPVASATASASEDSEGPVRGRGAARFASGKAAAGQSARNSGSRDARARREARVSVSRGRTSSRLGRTQLDADEGKRPVLGLGMRMGPPASASEKGESPGTGSDEGSERRSSGFWDFNFAGLMRRMVGTGTQEGAEEEDGGRSPRRRTKSAMRS
ncbi:hypothetical protein Rhopal_007394-T1 [Rhodotorula paludigena]|uniref:Protein kinase domain-containing protein n=1 Tax=Rhodotorula paludigena TaxID=86838 RepID=A0AAV5GXX5_9BASI|nr:hypothetical protein Rhopal_007394-T1 [Rhodotorula paludigena]